MEVKKWNFKGFGQPTLWVEGNFLKYKGAGVPENIISLDLLTGVALESKGNKLLSMGKLVIYAGGTKAVEMACSSPNAKELVQEISEYISSKKKAQDTKNLSIDDLEKLAILKEKGHITEEEFNLKKSEILGNKIGVSANTKPESPIETKKSDDEKKVVQENNLIQNQELKIGDYIKSPTKFLEEFKVKKYNKNAVIAASFYFFLIFFGFKIIFSGGNEGLKIESAPKENEITAASEITFTGKGVSTATLTINANPVKIENDKFTANLPLVIGKNEFKIHYENDKTITDKTITINRLTEKELAAKKAEQPEIKKSILKGGSDSGNSGSRTTVGGQAACLTEEYLDDIITAAVNKDEGSFQSYLTQQKCVILKDGIPVTIMKVNFTTIQFMYNGVKFWTVREGISR